MLITLSNSYYFNFALSSYFSDIRNDESLIDEIFSYPSIAKDELMHDLQNTLPGKKLKFIVIDHTTISIETLQFIMLLRTFYPLAQLFILKKPEIVFDDLVRLYITILDAKTYLSLSELFLAINDVHTHPTSPADKIYLATALKYGITKEEAIVICLMMSGSPLSQIAKNQQCELKKIYYHCARARNKMQAKDNNTLVKLIQTELTGYYMTCKNTKDRLLKPSRIFPGKVIR